MARFSLAEGLKKLFGAHTRLDDDFFDDLADSLIEGDLGPKTAFEVCETLRARCMKDGITDRDSMSALLAELLSPWILEYRFEPPAGRVSVALMLGVNGAGKTTTAAKMAVWYKKNFGSPIVLAAADTFRAAAIEQLQTHGERISARVVAHKHGADPGAVVFDAAEAVRGAGGGLVIADTAGRLHNKDNLIRELQKIDRIAASRSDEGCYRKFLVIDATTGQNGLRQAEVFHQAIGVDAIVLTKYDSTARGGIAVTAGKELSLPVIFVGTGETYGDFMPFERSAYLKDFLGNP